MKVIWSEPDDLFLEFVCWRFKSRDATVMNTDMPNTTSYIVDEARWPMFVLPLYR